MRTVRSSSAGTDWLVENDRRLTVAARRVGIVLEARLAGELVRFDAGADLPPPVEHLARRFGLSQFERDLFFLCALFERHGELGAIAGRLRAEPNRAHVDYELAATLLDAPDRVALSPTAALRRWRLLELAPGDAPFRGRLTVDERTMFFLEGHTMVEPRLDGLIRPLTALPRAPAELVARIAALFRGARSPGSCPVIELCGERFEERAGVVRAVAGELGLHPFMLSATEIPAMPAEREALARLWEREAMLLDALLVVDLEELDRDAGFRLRAFLETLESLVFVSSRGKLPKIRRSVFRVQLSPRGQDEDVQRWRAALGPLAEKLNGGVERVANQFRLDDDALSVVAASAQGRGSVRATEDALWDGARVQARRGLDQLAERIDARAEWADLILPPAHLEVLHRISAHVRERHRVYREWGFAEKSDRGLGIAALFAGGSGTGKTLAAEVIASGLRLDLYRIDLARLISKYIGDTEKNLAGVFDAAETSGAILLFDEADALFGKRSEVRDSHDRYANIEVSYLLQRIESYRGLAILTTNMKHALDSAFLRRFRFIVQFPFPDAPARRDIWSRVIPDAAPRNALDLAKLARLNLTGGQIRNVAMNAAFLAAAAGEAISMGHMRAAAESEYGKLERPLSRSDVGDWI